MAVEHSVHYARMSLEEYLTLVKQDSEHAYEYLDGRVYMMTGGSPDHSIIGSNLNGLLQAFLRSRRCNALSGLNAIAHTMVSWPR